MEKRERVCVRVSVRHFVCGHVRVGLRVGVRHVCVCECESESACACVQVSTKGQSFDPSTKRLYPIVLS